VTALLQVEEAHERLAELVRASGEELVLGEGFEELDERLVVVGALEEVLGDGDLTELAAEDRRLPGRLRVRLAREQTEETEERDRVGTGAAYRDRESSPRMPSPAPGTIDSFSSANAYSR
jgi:hypothetical protein